MFANTRLARAAASRANSLVDERIVPASGSYSLSSRLGLLQLPESQPLSVSNQPLVLDQVPPTWIRTPLLRNLASLVLNRYLKED